ncbi:hypothetical protein PP301_gp008 [Gordonia phage GMA2]|uniref:DUF1360 domain-containing protein n=1 Tax=Gordonia phage GMA2 TaxID=1647283 RepID=A0A0K0N7B4_9CAUD|nr:hypothetical protein PP301_gp008 [Gordonia phage GMA2]AKJ72546.1 hypothetical protein GMA2_8 [Gordonia phage GMA2]
MKTSLSYLRYAVMALAAHRITTLIIEDEISSPIRDRVLDSTDNYMVRYLLTCHKCMSVWSAFVVILLGHGSLGRVLLNTMALSEAAILIQHALDNTSRPSLMN